MTEKAETGIQGLWLGDCEHAPLGDFLFAPELPTKMGNYLDWRYLPLKSETEAICVLYALTEYWQDYNRTTSQSQKEEMDTFE